MMIHAYVLTHDEEYMLPYWLRCYERFADRLFVVDHASQDRTRAIATAHSKVTLVDYPGPPGMNDAAMSRVIFDLYHEHSRGVADWVVLSDCDEMLWHEDIVGLLTRLKGQTFAVRADPYQMVTTEPPQTTGQLWEVAAEGVREWRREKIMVWDPAIDVLLTDGRHAIASCDPPIPPPRDHGVKLLHYHYLGAEYLSRRLKKNLTRQNRPQHAQTAIRHALGRYATALEQRRRIM